jgi:hypothetical protein
MAIRWPASCGRRNIARPITASPTRPGDKIHTGLQVAHRTLRPLIVA